MQSIRVAIIGLGHVAQYQLRALELSPAFTLVAGCDKDRNKVQELRVPFFDNPEELLESVETDVVVVSTPIDQHFRITKFALDRKRNVLLEKPATLNMREFLDLKALAQENNVMLLIAFHAAFAKDVVFFVDACKDLMKDIGPLTAFRCSFFDPYVKGEELDPHVESLGGSWMDSGINALSVIGRLLDIRSLTLEDAKITRIPHYRCFDVQSTVDFTFSSANLDCAGRGTIETNWTLGRNQKLTRLFFGNSLNEVILDHSAERVILRTSGGSASILADLAGAEPRLVNHYVGVFRDLESRLLSGKDNLSFAATLHDLLFSAYG